MSNEYFKKVWKTSKNIFRKEAANVGPVLLENLRSELKKYNMKWNSFLIFFKYIPQNQLTTLVNQKILNLNICRRVRHFDPSYHSGPFNTMYLKQRWMIY